MTPDTVVQIVREALMATFWLAAPLLAVGFAAGIAVSLVQIATSMQDIGVQHHSAADRVSRRRCCY